MTGELHVTINSLTMKDRQWTAGDLDVMAVPAVYVNGKPFANGRMDLDELLAKIKEIKQSLPVVLITKSEEETLMEEAIGKRITDYLIKPVNPSQVFLACKRVFDSQKLQDSQRARDYVCPIAFCALVSGKDGGVPTPQ